MKQFIETLEIEFLKNENVKVALEQKAYMRNQFEYYGPDFSYDALELKKGLWNLVEEFDVKNLN